MGGIFVGYEDLSVVLFVYLYGFYHGFGVIWL
jgi:hypothetical protein